MSKQSGLFDYHTSTGKNGVRRQLLSSILVLRPKSCNNYRNVRLTSLDTLQPADQACRSFFLAATEVFAGNTPNSIKNASNNGSLQVLYITSEFNRFIGDIELCEREVIGFISGRIYKVKVSTEFLDSRLPL